MSVDKSDGYELLPPVYVEGNGPQSIVQIAESVLYDDNVDVGVIRNMLGPAALEGASECDPKTLLYDTVPLIGVVVEMAADYIDTNYRGKYTVKRDVGFRYEHTVNDESQPHIDSHTRGSNLSPGPLSLSLTLTGAAMIATEKPRIDSYCPEDIHKHNLSRLIQLIRDRTFSIPGNCSLRSMVIQRPGDAYIFSNNPKQSVHEASFAPGAGGRRALLFDMWLEKCN